MRSWDRNSVQNVVQKINEHSEHKRRLLSQMIDYGENGSTCRRKYLLRYFSSTEFPGSQFECCDICNHNGVVGFLSNLGRAIYECVRDNNEQLSYLELVGVLRGTSTNHLSRAKHYGRLSNSSERRIRGEIDRMLERGFIKRGTRGLWIPSFKNLGKQRS